MFRSALIALQPGSANPVVMSYALALAKKQRLRLVGVAFFDMALLTPPAVMPMGEALVAMPHDAALLEQARQESQQALDEFSQQCRAADVPHESLWCEGDTAQEVSRAVQRCDVLLLERTGGVGGGRWHVPSVLHEVIRHCGRPAIVVPEAASECRGVVVAYDGSVQAVRAVQAFASAGLWSDCPIRVVTFHDRPESALRTATLAADFLRSHQLEAEPFGAVLVNPVAELIHEQVLRMQAGLLVMGAFGHSAVRDFFFGSVTQTTLRASAIPVFLDH